MWVRIWKSTVKWGLRYASYDAELVERTKKLSRIFWSPRHRAGIVPDEQSIYEMMEILKGEGVSIFAVVKENELLGFWMQKNLVKATTKHNIKGESKKQALVDAMCAHGYSAKT
ncbi:hypothetical protein ABEX25_27285 [Paenibacillus thiaminolyticus]|uniref:hypothetical protein n=1 Tax=Paenibacillus thiaminolyticus TaxID=49283 RepID=UPI003D27FEA3